MTKKPTRSRRSSASQDALRESKAEVFQVLGHPKRIHIVEVLRHGALSVTSIQENVGIQAPAVSQHLAILRAQGLVTARRVGNQVFYRLRDPLLIDVLDTMRLYFHARLQDAVEEARTLQESQE